MFKLTNSKEMREGTNLTYQREIITFVPALFHLMRNRASHVQTFTGSTRGARSAILVFSKKMTGEGGGVLAQRHSQIG